MRIIIQYASDLLGFLCLEGSWSFREHESFVVKSVLASLETPQREYLESLLGDPFFVERSNGGRINILRTYVGLENNTNQFPEFSDSLFKVQLLVSGEKSTANLLMYDGRVFSVEFQHQNKFYRNKELSVSRIIKGESSDSFTHDIDPRDS